MVIWEEGRQINSPDKANKASEDVKKKTETDNTEIEALNTSITSKGEIIQPIKPSKATRRESRVKGGLTTQQQQQFFNFDTVLASKGEEKHKNVKIMHNLMNKP